MLKPIKELLRFDSYEQLSKKGKRSFQKKTTTKAFDFLQLVNLWPEIVGEVLAKHTIPIKNAPGTLTILSNHSAFSHQLSFMQEVLIKKITKVFPELDGKLKKINFQVNSTFFQEKKKFIEKSIQVKKETLMKPELHPYSPKYKALKEKAVIEFSHIKDPELKNTLISIFIQSKITH